jgi:hypothetical protein
LAWLQQPVDKKADSKFTRLQRRLDSDTSLGLPHVQAEHIVRVLNDLGWCDQSGMGIRPISYAELVAWIDLTGRDLADWELRAVRAGTAAFCAQHQSEDPREPSFDPGTAHVGSPLRARAAALGAVTTTRDANENSKTDH